MTGDAVAEAVEAIGASVSALAVLARRGTDGPELTGARSGAGAGPNVLVRDQRDPLQDQVDPLQERADAVLDGLAEAARLEARAAALKVRLAAEYADISAAMAPPAESLQDREIRRMSLTAEVAGALTVSEGAAERLLVESATLSNTLPLALEALQTGTISWQHVRVMCDETSGLDPVSAAALEAHFLARTRPGPPAGVRPVTWCPPGSGRRYVPGGSGIIRTASKPVTRRVPRTAGWSMSLTRMAWRGSRPTFPRTRPPGFGTAPPPRPGPCRAPPNPGP
jgi:hypothetical protein